MQMRNFAYGDKYAAFLHDAVLLYAIALNESMTKGLDYENMPSMSRWTDTRLGLKDGIWERG